MTESHLARTLFSQPSNTTARKKILRPVESSADKETKPDTSSIAESIISQQTNHSRLVEELTKSVQQWQDKYQALEQRCSELGQQVQDREVQLKTLQDSLSQLIAQKNEQTMLIKALQEQNQQLEKQLAEAKAKLAHNLSLLLSAEVAPAKPDASHQQISELQEQILHQADQIKEYQATIQHWKDQAIKHQQHAMQLSSAIERLLSEKPAIAKVVKPKPETKSEPKCDPMAPKAKIELPAFLMRTR